MNIYEKIIEKHGAYNQSLKAVEEFSELSRAIVRNKIYGDKDSIANLLEEIADAHIMLEQLKIMFPMNCVTWFDIQFPKIKQALFHPPNGGERPSFVDEKGRRYCPEGEKLKRMGAREGVLDLCLAIPKRGFTGLWIEFKSKNGVWSAEQRAFRTLMQEHRWYVQEITEFEDFVKLIKDYLY